MTKIDGKYKSQETEELLLKITNEDSITKSHHLTSKYLYQRIKQVEKILTNIDDKDIDLELVIEQLWNDLQLAHNQIHATMRRVDYYAKKFLSENQYFKLKEGKK